ncbi:hypothetical protein ACJOT4_18395 [Nocardiopsis sp. frass4]
MLARAPEPAAEDVAAARLIARMAPEPPPRYHGHDLSHHLLVDVDGEPVPMIDRELSRPLLHGLLQPFGEHHCQTPDLHECVQGGPCVRYARTAENLRLLLVSTDAYRRWSAPVADVFTDGRPRFSPPLSDLVVLAHRAAGPAPVTDSEELAALAVGGLPRGAEELHPVIHGMVRRADPAERWAVAATLREAGPVLAHTLKAARDLRRRLEYERVREAAGEREPVVRDDNAFFYVGMSLLLSVFAGLVLTLGEIAMAAVLGAVALGTAVVGVATSPGRVRRIREVRDREKAERGERPPRVEGLRPVAGGDPAHLRELEGWLGSLADPGPGGWPAAR